MNTTIKRIAVWTITIPIVIGHFIAYKNGLFGIDQLIPCVIAYPSLAAILDSIILNNKS